MRSYKFPCHAVALVHIAEGIPAAKAVAVHDCFHQTANIEEANFVLKEELDSFLIGTVGGTGAETALFDGLLQAARQRKVSSSATSKVSTLSAAKSSSGTTPGTRFG